ncbi:hypothetical protein [Streptomyces sp. NBC_01594]|uniref:hypothetical protein n=1 Tax=Streptomyces sp. NBC_01594 TaxID=2975890 RepID=UPI00386ABE4E
MQNPLVAAVVTATPPGSAPGAANAAPRFPPDRVMNSSAAGEVCRASESSY